MTVTAKRSNSKNRWFDAFPWLGEDPVAADACVSEAHFELEREKIFRKSWWPVCRVEEIEKPGDFMVRKIHFADTSVVVLRGGDDKISAFYNVCSHRGNSVISVTPGEHKFFGRARGEAVVCRFHGWVYGTRGDLIYVPQEDRFPEKFQKCDNGLAPIRCEIWNGFVFINLQAQPTQTLSEYLAGFDTYLDGYRFEKASRVYRYYTYLKCNWKIGLDAFSEAYHVDTIHAGTFPVDRAWLDDIAFFGPHRTSSVLLKMDSVPPAPVQAMAFKRSNASLADLGRGATMLPPTLNPQKNPNWTFALSVLFPSFLIHPAEGFYFTHQFWPVTADTCLWEGSYYMVPPKSNSEYWGQEYAMVLQRNAWLEDTETMENTHHALMSGGKTHINLMDEEVLVRHSYKMVENMIAGREVF